MSNEPMSKEQAKDKLIELFEAGWENYGQDNTLERKQFDQALEVLTRPQPTGKVKTRKVKSFCINNEYILVEDYKDMFFKKPLKKGTKLIYEHSNLGIAHFRIKDRFEGLGIMGKEVFEIVKKEIPQETSRDEERNIQNLKKEILRLNQELKKALEGGEQ